MSYSTLPTVNPGDVISASAWGNIAKANEDYLFSGRPGQTIKRDNGGSYSTSSLSFVNVDGTNLSVTQLISSGAVIITFTGMIVTSNSAHIMCFDITVDGTRIGTAGNDGLTGFTTGATGVSPVMLCVIVTGLSVGSHTFTLQWKQNTSGTATLYAGNGTADQDSIPTFAVKEIG